MSRAPGRNRVKTSLETRPSVSTVSGMVTTRKSHSGSKSFQLSCTEMIVTPGSMSSPVRAVRRTHVTIKPKVRQTCESSLPTDPYPRMRTVWLQKSEGATLAAQTARRDSARNLGIRLDDMSMTQRAHSAIGVANAPRALVSTTSRSRRNFSGNLSTPTVSECSHTSLGRVGSNSTTQDVASC